jgi:hypothetical protein
MEVLAVCMREHGRSSNAKHCCNGSPVEYVYCYPNPNPSLSRALSRSAFAFEQKLSPWLPFASSSRRSEDRRHISQSDVLTTHEISDGIWSQDPSFQPTLPVKLQLPTRTPSLNSSPQWLLRGRPYREDPLRGSKRQRSIPSMYSRYVYYMNWYPVPTTFSLDDLRSHYKSLPLEQLH